MNLRFVFTGQSYSGTTETGRVLFCTLTTVSDHTTRDRSHSCGHYVSIIIL